MKTLLIRTLSLSLLTPTLTFATEESFEALASDWFRYKATIAAREFDSSTRGLVSPDYTKLFAKLSETDKIKFLLLWIGSRPPDQIDGEGAFRLRSMLGSDTENRYSQTLATQRLKTIQETPLHKREAFLKTLNLNQEWAESNLKTLERLLE